MNRKILLIDGSSLAYRSFYAFQNNPLTTSDGKPTSAVFGFARSLKKVIEDLAPDYAAVCFDLPEPTFRREEYEEYKANREEMPEELSRQIPDIEELCRAAGINVLNFPGFEADDIIATLVKKSEEEDLEAIIFTLDKDLMQLVSDKVKVLNMHRKGAEWYDRDKVEEKFGIPPEKINDYLALKGDSSDNIPGVRGIGKKTAVKLLSSFDSIEDIFSNITSVEGSGIRKKLDGKKEDALRWKKIISLREDVPVEVEIENLKFRGIDKKSLRELLEKLEFYSLIDEWVEREEKDRDIKIVDSSGDLKGSGPYSLLERDGIIYVCCSSNIKKMEKNDLSSFFKNLKGEKFILEDTKDFARSTAVYPEGEIYDLSIMHYLLFINRKDHSLDRIFNELGRNPGSPENTVASMESISDNLTERLKKEGEWSLYSEIEKPLIPVLYRMEKHGILFDEDILQELKVSLKTELEELEGEIFELAGEKFNLRSPKQLSEVLFDKLDLPVIKKTKTGFSTDAEVLEVLSQEHEIAPKIIEFRELDKLKNSYIEPLIKAIDSETGRIHPVFQQTATSTGRLTTTDPNLQTLPIQTERGRKIRKAVIAEEGNLILSCDYSQVELRILASLSEDERLIRDFEEGQDIHTQTACRIFGITRDRVDNSQRRKAKAVNFGIVYGISPYGLAKQLDISAGEAGNIIERYYENHPGVERWQKETIESAEDKGHTETIKGRKRRIPELNSGRTREYGKRIAMNTPIQGSAADIIKKAMIDIQDLLDGEEFRTRMILQIHDELLFEVPSEEKEEVVDSIVPLMENVIDLKVPLIVDSKFAGNWDDAH